MLLLEFANINNKFGECSLPDGNLRMLHRWRDTVCTHFFTLLISQALGSEVFHEQYLPHTGRVFFCLFNALIHRTGLFDSYAIKKGFPL